jgi:hypothetical protein
VSEIDDFDSPAGEDASSVWLDDLFDRTRLPGTAEELGSEAAVIGAMVRTIAEPALVSDLDARRRLVVSKTAARIAIAAAVLFVGTSTAAATGNLPDAAQSAVARVSSHLGVSIPDPEDERATDAHDAAAATSLAGSTTSVNTDLSTTSTELEESSTAGAGQDPAVNGTPVSTRPGQDPTAQEPVPTPGQGPDATGPAKQGLCRAWAVHRSDSPANQNSIAMRNLQAAADAAGQTVAEFCADVIGTDPTQATATTVAASPAPPAGNKKDPAPGPHNNAPPGQDKEKKPKGS